ncbi:hypothetical protein GCK72_023594 [Caenorhabditis remanei]|uniref:Uncharacterized protein n=1 Tax=Caenorhabditis remanei TaxID=31234 RepID=A0A6A5FXD1_CAERE|nr:hypothetical protein GCK72_023594 [Caenorhabditis remanei]KAF1747134.1 hypothetical protein GCK72_023594 [Caenorhabditis remanei]
MVYGSWAWPPRRLGRWPTRDAGVSPTIGLSRQAEAVCLLRLPTSSFNLSLYIFLNLSDASNIIAVATTTPNILLTSLPFYLILIASDNPTVRTLRPYLGTNSKKTVLQHFILVLTTTTTTASPLLSSIVVECGYATDRFVYNHRTPSEMRSIANTS